LRSAGIRNLPRPNPIAAPIDEKKIIPKLSAIASVGSPSIPEKYLDSILIMRGDQTIPVKMKIMPAAFAANQRGLFSFPDPPVMNLWIFRAKKNVPTQPIKVINPPATISLAPTSAIATPYATVLEYDAATVRFEQASIRV
jgi:hypothetical protein